jgi:hypothetical protein
MDEERKDPIAPETEPVTPEPVTPDVEMPEPVPTEPVAEPVAEPAPPERTLDEARPTPTLDRRLLIVTAVAALLAIATVLLALMVFAPRIAPVKVGATVLAAKAQEDEEILTVARRFSKNFLNHDYRSMGAFVDRVAADLTGSFREEFVRVNEISVEAFEKNKVVSKGKVEGAVLLYHEGSDARVQVLAQRTTSNVNAKEPRTEAKILNVFLVKTSDGWRVDNVGEPQEQATPGATR